MSGFDLSTKIQLSIIHYLSIGSQSLDRLNRFLLVSHLYYNVGHLTRTRNGKECMYNYLPVGHLSVQKSDQCP